MSAIFLKLVNMSISASWLVLTVLLLRLVFKKAPKWISVLLWGLVAVRLICPFSIESVLSLIPSAETISPEIMMDRTPEISTGIASMDAVVNPIITESFAPKPYASANPLQLLIPVCGNLWALGVLIMLLYTAVSYLLLWHKVATAVLLRDTIYQSECVDSPFVLGIIKPRIYLPFQMDGRHLEHVIAHEQSHIRRKDHLWKPLGFLLLALHWFNPLIWLGYTFLCRDIELACDEKVIKEMDSETKADYTQALVACSINHRRIAACPLAFGEVGVKARVKSVLDYKKPAFWIITVAVVVCVAVAVCFLTDPQKQTDSNTLDETLPDSDQVEMGETEKPLDENKSPEILKYATTEGFVNPKSIRFGYPWRIQLCKQKKDSEALTGSAYDLYIEVDTRANVFRKELETGMLPITEGRLSLGDIDGDQVKEIFVHNATGGVGGFGLWQTWVLKVEGGALQILFQNFDEFDTGFESRFLEGYQLEVTNRFTDYKQVFDASGYREYIDGFTKLPDGRINLDSFYDFYPSDTDDDGICEIVCKQYAYILDHADYTGTAYSVLKFDKRTQSFEVVNAWFEINTDTEYGASVQPEQITGITKAVLELPHSWSAPRTVTDPETLGKIERMLQRSVVLESGAGCLFTGRLTLTLTGGETFAITVSEDNCATWLSEGTYYDYGSETPEGISGNRELYDLFTVP